MAITNALKGIPGLVWAVVIYVYITGPQESVSQFSRWATWIGYPYLPEFWTKKAADTYVVFTAIAVLVIYIFLVWIWPWWRAKHPRWISFQIATQRAYEYGEKHNLLGLVTFGIFTDPLIYFSQALLSDGNVWFRGRRPPTNKVYPIAQAELKRMNPVPMVSRLASNDPADPFTYEDVEVRTRHVRRFLRKLRSSAL